MGREDDQKVAKLEALVASQQEQFNALLAIVAKLQVGAAPAKSGPRVEPKGLTEVRFVDSSGNRRRAWIESQRTLILTEGTNEKNRIQHEIEVADLCVELRPGKFHSIEGVPGLDVKRAGHLLNKTRWYTLEQEKAVNRYEEDLKRLASGATLQQAVKPAPADSDLGLKGA